MNIEKESEEKKCLDDDTISFQNFPHVYYRCYGVLDLVLVPVDWFVTGTGTESCN